MLSKEKEAEKLVANNKKAFHDYFIIETFEAGVSLSGTEVKSLRQGKCSIKEAYVQIVKGEAWVYGMNISPYEQGNLFNRDPVRPRKLLLHKREIEKLGREVQQQGFTIAPLRVYFSGRKVKMEIGLAKGKKLYDKRETIAKKDMKREAERALKERNF